MKKRIAVIGSGISGMAAAWLLNRKHQVHLFDKRSRLGGHTHTVAHSSGDGEIALDTGFIVFNEKTYPTLTRVFAQLGIATQSSDMSFAVSSRTPDLEYAGSSLRGLFAQPQNAFRPWYLGFLRDIWRFGRVGEECLERRPNPSATVGDFLREEKFGAHFGKYFLLPMTAAIWSTGTGPTNDFPRDTLLRFFANHGLLSIKGQPEWKTVIGGSSAYIPEMTRDFADRIHLGHGVDRVERRRDEVIVYLENGSNDRFDHVVIATHADQALALLAEPTTTEQHLLGAWRYSDNDTWLHTDASLMPKRRAAWASWNYLIEGSDQSEDQVCVSYHLNRLQRIESTTDYMVSLNPPRQPQADTVIRRLKYHHPIYDKQSAATQEQLPVLNGRNRTHFCGAYFRYGFHEDGLVSAVRVAEEFGVTL